MVMRLCCLGLAFILLLTACSVQQRKQLYTQASSVPITVALTSEVNMPLPPPRFQHSLKLKQLLKARYTDNEFTPLLVALELNPQSLTLAGFTPLGVRLFSCSYDGQELQLDTVFADRLPPLSQIVLDILLSFYPLEALNTYLPSGFKAEDHGQLRLLMQGDKIVYEIGYTVTQTARLPVHIEHKIFCYQINLTYLAQ